MTKLNILLMCSSGMSSTIIRKNMETAAQKKGIILTVTAKAESAVSIEKDIMPADIILLAPQIRYIKNDIQKKAGNKPVEIMEMREYGLGDGEGILNKCLKILGINRSK